jgi:multiple sugar transport system substrate-binding protein
MKDKRSSRRDFLRTVAAATAGAVLAACQPKTIVVKETVEVQTEVEKVIKETVIVEGTPKVVKETVIVEGTPEVVEKVVTPTPVPAEPTTVEFWNMEGRPERQEIWQQLIEMFQAKYPHITIDMLNTSRQEGREKLLVGLETGVLPDCAFPADSADVLAEQGALLELTYLFNQWEEKDLIDPGLVASHRKQMPGGGLYSIPQRAIFGVLYYRNKWFEEAELDPVTTTDELRQAAEALTDKSQGRAGYILRGGAGNIGYAWHYGQTFSLLPLYNADGTSNMADPDFVAGVKFWTDLHLDGLAQDTAPTDSYRELLAVFHGDGGAILEHNTGSLVDHLAKLGEEEFRASYIPVGPKGKRLIAEMTGNGGYVFADAEDLDATWKWFSYGVSVEGGGFFSEKNGTPPANMGVREQSWFKDSPYWPALFEGVDDGNTLYWSNPPNPLFTPYLINVAMPGLQEVLLGEKDVQAWCAEVATEQTTTMQQYMTEKGIAALDVEPHE